MAISRPWVGLSLLFRLRSCFPDILLDRGFLVLLNKGSVAKVRVVGCSRGSRGCDCSVSRWMRGRRSNRGGIRCSDLSIY